MKLESSATFYTSKEDENTHVLDTTAKLPKWRPRRQTREAGVLVRMPGCVNLLPVAVLARPVVLS